MISFAEKLLNIQKIENRNISQTYELNEEA